tara:strand:- start:7640 stop:8308 length:669 start_codon:yes stop_codon:yes gene_type:complete
MYSFAQREDTVVLDEPFYAHYLLNSDVSVNHPSAKKICATMERDELKIVQNIANLSERHHVFVKGMAHHYLSDSPDFILKWDNIILIRHPEKLLASFSKVIKNPTIQDIGIKKASEIFTYLQLQGKTPIVLESDALLKNPSAYLKKVCGLVSIPFTETMLSWQKGGIPEDGIWAKHWYQNVHNSEGFAPQKTSSDPMPSRLEPVLDEAMEFYTILRNHILTV